MASFIPSTKGTGLDRQYGGVPLIIWVVGGALALGVGYHFYSQSKQQAAQNAAGGAASTTTSTAPQATMNPVAIDPTSAFAQGITDQYGNLLPQFTWPYNQLALPYNYGPYGLGGNANAAYDYISAQSPNFVGNQSTPIYNFSGGQ